MNNIKELATAKIRKLDNLIDWSNWHERDTVLDSKVEAYCIKCNKPRLLTINALYRIILKKKNYMCMSCAVKEGIKNSLDIIGQDVI